MLPLRQLPHKIPDQTWELPPAYHRVFELELTNVSPWRFLEDEEASGVYSGLRELYPDHILLPFARRDDNDDAACFVISSPTLPVDQVVVVHLFADEPDAFDAVYDSFWDWFRSAVDEMIEASP